MIYIEPSTDGYRLEIGDRYGVRGYDIDTDALDSVTDEETYDGITAMLTELEIMCSRVHNTPSERKAAVEAEWKDQEDEDRARANQGRI